jgi:hypothetical protein
MRFDESKIVLGVITCDKPAVPQRLLLRTVAEKRGRERDNKFGLCKGVAPTAASPGFQTLQILRTLADSGSIQQHRALKRVSMEGCCSTQHFRTAQARPATATATRHDASVHSKGKLPAAFLQPRNPKTADPRDENGSTPGTRGAAAPPAPQPSSRGRGTPPLPGRGGRVTGDLGRPRVGDGARGSGGGDRRGYRSRWGWSW